MILLLVKRHFVLYLVKVDVMKYHHVMMNTTDSTFGLKHASIILLALLTNTTTGMQKDV